MLDDRYLDGGGGGSENETMHCKLKKVEWSRLSNIKPHFDFYDWPIA